MTIRIPPRTAPALGIPIRANGNYDGGRFNVALSLAGEGGRGLLDKRNWCRFRFGSAARMSEKLHKNVIGLAFMVPGRCSDPCFCPDRGEQIVVVGWSALPGVERFERGSVLVIHHFGWIG